MGGAPKALLAKQGYYWSLMRRQVCTLDDLSGFNLELDQKPERTEDAGTDDATPIAKTDQHNPSSSSMNESSEDAVEVARDPKDGLVDDDDARHYEVGEEAGHSAEVDMAPETAVRDIPAMFDTDSVRDEHAVPVHVT